MKIDKQSFQQIRKDRDAADLTLTKCNHFLTSVTEETFFFFAAIVTLLVKLRVLKN